MTPTLSRNADEGRDLTSLGLREIGEVLQRRWSVVVLTVLACAGLSILAFAMIKPRYEAKSEVIVDPPRHRALSQDERSSDNPLLDSSVIDSQIPLIVSNRNLARVIRKERLAEDDEFADVERLGLRGSDTALDDPNRIDPWMTPVITRLGDHVDVARVGKSNVLAIRVYSHDPQKAARLANVIAEDYVADQVDSRVRITQQAATLFTDRLDALRGQVRSSENALAAYRQHNGMATTSDEKITISDQQLGNLNERLAFAASDTALKLAKYEQVLQFERGSRDLSALTEVVQSPVISQLRTQLADVRRREADLSTLYGDSYPDVGRLRSQDRSLQKALAGEVARLTSMLKNDYVVTRQRESTLKGQIGSLITPAGVAPDAGVELRELERTNLANKALFENFLARAKLTQEESTFEVPDSRLISPALTSVKPTFPKIQVFLPAGILAGLVLGLLAALLMDRYRPGIRRISGGGRFTRPQPAE